MPLSIAAAQPALAPGDVVANVSAHADTVSAAQARVVVFPELSLTGYLLDAPAIEPDDPRLAPLVDACAATGALALAGAPVANGAGRSIGVLAVTGEGVSVAYRKMWLGGAEPERLVPGRAPTVLEVDGWRLGLAVCKDTGVPQHAADTAALGVDAYVAGVLEHAADADVQPQRAQRIVAAHRVWVVIASFAGAAGGGYDLAAGGSAVWSPDGALVAAAGSRPGEIARTTLTARSWEAGPTRTPRPDAPSARGRRPRP